MLGCEVGRYLDLYKGALYKKYPSLWKKVLSPEERDALAKEGVRYRTLCNIGTMIVRASEAEQILKGEGSQFKIGPKASAFGEETVISSPVKERKGNMHISAVHHVNSGINSPVKMVRPSNNPLRESTSDSIHMLPIIKSDQIQGYGRKLSKEGISVNDRVERRIQLLPSLR